MKRAALAFAAVAVLASGLVSCAAPESAPTPTPSPTSTAEESTAPPATALGMCEVMGEKFLEYPDYVTALLDGDASAHAEYLAWADRLTAAAPTDAKTVVAKFTDPIYQVETVMQQGGGELTLSTVDYKEGTLEIVEYCVDAGFKIDQ